MYLRIRDSEFHTIYPHLKCKYSFYNSSIHQKNIRYQICSTQYTISPFFPNDFETNICSITVSCLCFIYNRSTTAKQQRQNLSALRGTAIGKFVSTCVLHVYSLLYTIIFSSLSLYLPILQAFGIGTHLRNRRKKRNEKCTTSRPLAMHRLTRVPTYRYMVGLMLLPLSLLVLFIFTYSIAERLRNVCVCVLLFSSSFVYYHLVWNFSTKYLYSISFTLTHR